MTHRGLGVVALCYAACVNTGSRHIDVEPAPAPGVVTFVLDDTNLVYGLSVTTCRGRDMWTISNAGLRGTPDRITYGVAPDGFTTKSGPRQLTPDCYEVIVSGPAHTRFRIGPDGHLVTKQAPNVTASLR